MPQFCVCACVCVRERERVMIDFDACGRVVSVFGCVGGF